MSVEAILLPVVKMNCSGEARINANPNPDILPFPTAKKFTIFRKKIPTNSSH